MVRERKRERREKEHCRHELINGGTYLGLKFLISKLKFPNLKF